jgi:lysophospholipase L1-like esterase
MLRRWLLISVCLLVVIMLVFVFRPNSISNPTFEVVPPEPVKKDITIVSVGDSLTEGVGDPTKQGYVGYVREQLAGWETIDDVTLYNYAARGDETEDLLENLQSKEIANNIEKADYIMLTIGGNDLMKVVENNFFNLTVYLFEKQEDQYEENLKEIFEMIRKHNKKAQIIYVGVFNPFSKYFSQIEEVKDIVFSWNEASRKVVSQFNNTVFVPTYDLFINKSSELFSDDNFHPNQRGYEVMGNRVMNYIEH